MPARDPRPDELTAMLQDEAKRDASPLADMLFGQDAFTDSRNVDRPEYLKFFRYASEHGLIMPDGTQVPGNEWRMKTLDRLGPERFWADIHDAYDLSPSQGLAKVRMALEPPEMTPPPVPPFTNGDPNGEVQG